MKLLGVLTGCALLSLPMAVCAQESSKSSAGTGIEIADLIARFAKRTGKPFVLDPRVRAQVPLAGIDANDLSYDQLLAVLDVHQFAVVDAGGVLAVVPDANARQLATPVHTDASFKAADYELVSLLVTPRNVCAMHLVPVLRPLMPQAAHLAAEIQTNTLIINDRAANARRIAALVDQLDKRGKGVKDCPPAGFSSQAPAAAAPAKPAT